MALLLPAAAAGDESSVEMGGTGRKKRQKKSMTFYRVAFGLSPPYPVVMHPEFVRQCVKARVNLKDQLPKVMQDKAYPVVTKCIVEALRRSDDTGCAVLARQFQRVPCTHTKVQRLAGKEQKKREAPDGRGDEEDEEEEEEDNARPGLQERRHDRKGKDTVPIVRPGTCIRSLLGTLQRFLFVYLPSLWLNSSCLALCTSLSLAHWPK